MVKCSAFKCNSASYKKTPGISFHRFPKDDDVKKVWMQNLNRQNWHPTSSSVLCSKHFEAHLKDTSSFCTTLQPGAIPTIFEETSENEENFPTTTYVRKRCSAGKIVSALRDVQNTPEPQPCSSTHTDISDDSSGKTKNIKENFSIPPLRRKCAVGYFTSVLPDVQNIPEPEPTVSVSTHSAQCTSFQFDSTKKIQHPEEIQQLKRKMDLKNRKIKTLQQKTRRLKSQVSKFSEIISNLKKKISQDDISILSSIPVNNKEFFTRFLKKGKGAALEKSYSPELRSFALQLHFYSPRAYNYVRNTFSTVLPHPGTLSRWYKNIDAEPGFTSESFETLEALSKNSEKKVFVNLSIDEMAIRKGLVWDGSENRYKGYVDTGTGVSDDSLPLATQALVMLVTAINFNWVLPIAYFFINSVTGEQRANLMKMAIEMLFKINVFVCGITFDGAASNISMATHLGCNFTLNNFKPFFYFQKLRVNVFFDPCHMIKLIRNTLGDFKTIIDSDGNVIDFKYLNLLLDLQNEKGLHLANKLRQAHIMFSKQKMKVRLATQLLSKSVADALSFCKDNLLINEFKYCAATVRFITTINDIFDVLNSRSTLAPGYKKVLCAANIQKIKEESKLWISYLKCLKLSNGNLVTTSARKTGFIGFIVCLHSALNMFDDLICKEKLRFLTVYKISQDFLEMFFGKMRAQGGFNDNPNVVQFKSAYKKNVIQLKLKLQKDGFTTPNSILTVSSARKTIDTLNNSTPSFEQNVMDLCEIKEEDIDCFLDSILSTPLDDYTHHITIYIAGFVARKVIKVVKCSICQIIVIGVKENFLCSLINKKDRGGLIYPSDGVIKIIQSCEKIFKTFPIKLNYNSMLIYVADSLNYGKFLKSGNDHHDVNHLHLLMMVIVKFYVDLRCKYNAKQSNLTDRNYLKKMILFKNK